METKKRRRWSLEPKFAGSNPAEAVEFLRAKKSSARHTSRLTELWSLTKPAQGLITYNNNNNNNNNNNVKSCGSLLTITV